MRIIAFVFYFIIITSSLCFGQNWINIHDAMIDRAKIITINNKRTLFFQTFGLTGAPFLGCNDSTIFRTYKLNSSANITFKPYNGFFEPFICIDYILTESCMFYRPDEFDVSNHDSGFVIKYYQSMLGTNCTPPYIRKIITSTGNSTPGDTSSAKVIRISPFHDNKIFSLINNYLYRSTNRGQNWVYVPGTPGNLRDVIFNPFDSDYVYLISSQNQNTMLISTDGGINFNLSALNFNSSASLYFKTKDTILTYNAANLYRSDDRGINWSLAGTGPGNFNCLEFHPSLKNVFYAGFGDLGLYVSTNAGVNFTLYNNSFTPNNHVYAILKVRPDIDSVYVVTGRGVYLTYDQYVTKITQTSYAFPDKFILYNNYPNPFNPVTHLEFGISKLKFVTLKVYNVLGNEIKTLLNENKSPGRYTVEFNGSNFPSGIYFYKISAGEFTEVKKMTLLK